MRFNSAFKGLSYVRVLQPSRQECTKSWRQVAVLTSFLQGRVIFAGHQYFSLQRIKIKRFQKQSNQSGQRETHISN